MLPVTKHGFARLKDKGAIVVPVRKDCMYTRIALPEIAVATKDAKKIDLMNILTVTKIGESKTVSSGRIQEVEGTSPGMGEGTKV
jgi:hypothetical protein